MADALAFTRTFEDAQRRALAIKDRTLMVGPLEVTSCSHGEHYSFRYEWIAGSGGPGLGEFDFVIVANRCLDCACLGEMQPGRHPRS